MREVSKVLNSHSKDLLHELIQKNQFVNYKLEPKDGRVTKPPVDADGYKINAQDPANLRSFDEVLEVSNQIGFVLTDDDPFLFIDLDHVLKEGKLCGWAEKLIAELPATYTEISPSGDGLHLYYMLYDTPSIPKHKQTFPDGTALEIYFSGRYFTITGNVFVDSPITAQDLGDL
jgi:primase-polymerase (primpol)-like protein